MKERMGNISKGGSDSFDVTHSSNRQAYTPVMSMLQKAVLSTHCQSHCTSCNRPAHTNVIVLIVRSMPVFMQDTA